MVTGHYGSIGKTEEGRYYVKRAGNEKKDQSYVLWGLCQEDLALLRQQGDRYAVEMLEYMMEAARARQPQADETPQILEVGA